MQSLPILPPQFGIKLIKRGGIEKQFNTIERLVNKADSIINCGDAGQEGELIQRWVLQKANNRKPVQRLWISSLTEEAIREGFSKLKDASEFDNLYAAGSVRAIGDWLLGINATRLYTLKRDEAEKALTEIKEATFIIESFLKKKGKEYAPKLFDLTSLQVECNKKLGYSA